MQIKATSNVKIHFGGGVLWGNFIMQIKTTSNVKIHLGGGIMG